MAFSCKRIFHNIRHHLGVCFIFIVEFAIGVAILGGTINIFLSLQRDLKAEQEKMAGKQIGVSVLRKGQADDTWSIPWEEQIPISYDTYLESETLYGEDLKISYTLQGSFVDGVWDGHYSKDTEVDFIYFDAWFVNDAFFEDLFGIPMEPGKIYAGEKAYDNLIRYRDYHANPKYIYGKSSYPEMLTIENGKFCLSKNHTYELTPAPPSENEYIKINGAYFVESDYPLITDCVFIPLEEFPIYREVLRQEFDPYNHQEGDVTPDFSSQLSVEYKSADVNANIVPELLDYLMNQNKDYEFMIDQDLMALQRKADSIEQTIMQMIMVSSFILLIVVLGTTGLFLIFLYRRKKQMAISIAYGSTTARLFGEIFAEIFLITAVGAGLGLLALHFVMPYTVQLYSAVTFQPACILAAFLAALVNSVLTAVLSFTGIGKISPAKILKDL